MVDYCLRIGQSALAELRRLFAARCLVCTASGQPGGLCDGCHADLPRLAGQRCPCCAALCTGPGPCGRCQTRPPAYDQCRAAFSYEPPVDHLVSALKFNGRLACGRLLGRLLAESLQHDPQLSLPDLLIPVPLHGARLRQRGFNQASEIARVVAATLGLPIDRQALVRQRATAAQSSLPLSGRRKNLRDAFRMRRVLPVNSVALIDDVMTSGATADAAARCLKQSGIKRVQIWVVARAG